MTEPKRWAESGSDVDPVLRSVMRYSREVGPSPDQVRELMRGMRAAAKTEPARSPFRRPLHARPFLLAVAAVVVAGASFAAYRAYSSSPVRTRDVLEPAAPRPRNAPGAARHGERAAAPPAPPEDVAPRTKNTAAPAAEGAEPRTPESRAAPKTTPPKTAQLPAVPEDEVAVLEEARRLLKTNPAAALALTRDHAVRNPAGAFAEEREALAIEALRRLGRAEEAERHLRAFDAAYPRSPYRRRLGLSQ